MYYTEGIMSPLLVGLTACIVAGALFLGRTRRFYFVRHGETILNAQHVKQGTEGRLSELGKRQAAAAGERLAPLSIQKILSSPYERAKETVTIVNSSLNVPAEYSPLLAERRNPSDIIGKDRDDPSVAHIIDQVDLAYHSDDFRHADEENFLDLKERARMCLVYLILHGSTCNCVVTHHAFLKMLLSYMLYREELHVRAFVKLSFFNTSDNGGISVCEFHPWKILSRTRGWSIVSYNEQPD